MKIRNTEFDFENEKYIMGILNVTPDSFSDGGHFDTVEKAVSHARQMIEEGVDIIDIGGESTRPGHTPLSFKEEMDRVLPVIEKIREFSDIPISIDTYKAESMDLALSAGADIANDIWGFKKDPDMKDVVKKHDSPVILMHNKEVAEYKDFKIDYVEDIKESIKLAKEAGIGDDKIILDPGVGFAKNYKWDLQAIKYLDSYVKLGYPVLLATSRKRFIGAATGVDNPLDRLAGTIATTVYGATLGASIFRVHDVKANKEALAMTTEIMAEGKKKSSYNG
ncbi:MAG: dihydropteroate synthase [Anaerococcus sp.]|nr:dihydropteroate synthase [Anaerococcus sp.]